MLSRKTLAALVLILALAITLRTVGLTRLVYANPDEALWSYFIVTGAQLSPVSPHPSENALAHILSWDYGYPLFVVDYVYVRALEALRLPVSEVTLPLPLALFGTLNCLLVFFIAGRLPTRAVAGPPSAGGCGAAARPSTPQLACGALIAAALMAVMPLTVGRSRSIGGAEAFSGFVLLLAMLHLMRYLERPDDRRRQWLAGLCVGLYVCGDVQFLIGGAVLLGLIALWPMGSGDGSRSVTARTPDGKDAGDAAEGPESAGCRARLRLLWRPGVLIPPLVLFAPYVPAWLYAIHLGYRDQTYLGTVFAEHKADWGFHLVPFGLDLARNLGVFPLLALPVLAWYFARHWRRPQHSLLWWIGLTAFPFLFAVTSEVTQASGYHEHLAAALAIALGAALSALSLPSPSPSEGRLEGPLSLEGPDIIRPAVGSQPTMGRIISGPSNGVRLVTLIVILGALLVTLGGVFRVAPLVPLWPDSKIPYGGLVPNSGMKTAGYWVRQNLPPNAPVFVAHDPAVAYWHMGRECVTGGLIEQADRKQALLANAATIQAAVIPGGGGDYPPAFMAKLGFHGLIRVQSGGADVLQMWLRQPLHMTLDTEQTDPLYNATYRTSEAIIPPPWPYAPGKPVQAG